MRSKDFLRINLDLFLKGTDKGTAYKPKNAQSSSKGILALIRTHYRLENPDINRKSENTPKTQMAYLCGFYHIGRPLCFSEYDALQIEKTNIFQNY